MKFAPQDGRRGGFMFFPLWGGGYRAIVEQQRLNCRAKAKASSCGLVLRSGIIIPKWSGGAVILAPKRPKLLDVYDS